MPRVSVGPRPSAYRNAADIFREHAALSGFENRGTRLFDISAWSGLTDEAYDALEPTQWPGASARRRRSARNASSATGHSPPPPGAPASSPSPRATLAEPVCDGLSFRAQHRPRARSVAHHDAHGPQPAACGARQRTVRRAQSERCHRAGACPGPAGAGDDALRRSPAARHAERGAAAGLAVRADPLVGREQLRRPRRCACHSRRPIPFSGQPEVKATPARIAPFHIDAFRFPVGAPSGADRGSRLLGACPHAGRLSPPSSRSPPRPPAGTTGARAVCPLASASPTRMRAPSSFAWPCCETAGWRRCSTPRPPRAPLHRLAEDVLRPPRHPAQRASRPDRRPARRCRRRGECGVRLLPGRASAHSRRQLPAAPARPPRSAWQRGPAPTAARACPNSNALLASVPALARQAAE